MKIAIVTGMSRGIGLSLTQRLLADNFRVYGISRTTPSDIFLKENVAAGRDFEHIQMNLLDSNCLTQFCKDISKKEDSIDLLVNNAGIGAFAPHEELDITRLQNMLRLNLEVPILLTRLLLRSIKKAKGQILNISSITAQKESPYGCAYGATKAGLSHFSKSLFEEVRKSGVRIHTLHPDLTKTSFYDELSFTCADTANTHLLPEQAADAAMFMLSAPRNINIQDITLRPQKNQIVKKATHL